MLIGISVIWRKLVVSFDSYPWALAPAFDDRHTQRERDTTLEVFFKAPLCCLDLGLSRQLREAFPANATSYRATPLSQLLATVFMRLVMTGTPVELQFS